MKRIQRKREKGWRLPTDGFTLICDRTSAVYGNHYKIGDVDPETCEKITRERAIQLFEERQLPEMEKKGHLQPLRHYDYLACTCKLDEPCHVDSIIRRLKILNIIRR